MLTVTVLGTGSPVIQGTERAGPSALVTYQRDDDAPVRNYLVDAGRWVSLRLVQAGVRWPELDAVLFTHHHMDHTVGWADVLMSGWQMGRQRRWRVIGPPFTRNFCEAIEAAYEYDRDRRPSRESPEGGLHDVTEIIDAGVVIDQEGLRVTAAVVPHGPCLPSFAYRFDAAGHSVVISGDCRPSDSLRSLAAGADVLVHEVEFRPALQRQLQSLGVSEERQEQVFALMSELHSTQSEVADLAASAGVGTLMLTHFMPGVFDADELAAAVSARFSGRIVVSNDLDSVQAGG